MAAPPRLKLRARDVEDLQVLAACLQDALVPVSEIAYQRKERRLVLVANRFCWEQEEAADVPDAEPEPTLEPDARFEEALPPPAFARVNCGLTFDKVERVRVRGLDVKARNEILNLLTVEATPHQVTLYFSGGGAIRLEVEAIVCHLEDLGEPWPTRWRPAHALDETGSGG